MSEAMSWPPWVVLHVPHDSLEIPSSVRGQFLLNDNQLAIELARITDHHTLELFTGPGSTVKVVRSPVSRIVVDVERFENDNDEPMARIGMGAVYTVTSDLAALRRPLSPEERDSLMQRYYVPHHQLLEASVEAATQHHGHCLVVDCHSFPSMALPYESAELGATRPDICIGTDEFHTSEELARSFVVAFQGAGWNVRMNDPFSGALVPRSRYRRDRRVSAIMVEINRRLYLSEPDAERLPEFDRVARNIRRCCLAAICASKFNGT